MHILCTTCFGIMGCSCTEEPKGQTGALGGESQFRKNPKVVGDFRERVEL